MRSIDLSNLDLNLLVAFEALYQERSVTLAAQRLFLGQPAMSAALGRLRILFEDDLFVRIGREMQPTRRAEALAPGILAALHQIRQTLGSHQTFDPATSQECLLIGSSDYTSLVIMPRLLAWCRQEAPGLNLRLLGYEKDQVGQLLQEGTLDLALGVFADPPPQTHHEPLFEDRFIGIARKGHPQIRQGEITLATLAQLPHALVTLRQDETGYLDRVLGEVGLQRRIMVTTPHMLVLPYLLLSSDLIASIPSRIAIHISCYEELETFELPIEQKSWSVSLLWSRLADGDPRIGWLCQSLLRICEDDGLACSV